MSSQWLRIGRATIFSRTLGLLVRLSLRRHATKEPDNMPVFMPAPFWVTVAKDGEISQ